MQSAEPTAPLSTLPTDVRCRIYRTAARLAWPDTLAKVFSERPAVQEKSHEYTVTLHMSSEKTLLLGRTSTLAMEDHLHYDQFVYELDFSHIKVEILASQVLAVCFSCAAKECFISAAGVTEMYGVSHQFIACASSPL